MNKLLGIYVWLCVQKQGSYEQFEQSEQNAWRCKRGNKTLHLSTEITLHMNEISSQTSFIKFELNIQLKYSLYLDKDGRVVL